MTKSNWSYKYVEAVKQYLPGYKEANGSYFKGTKNATREDIAYALVKAKWLGNKEVDIAKLKQLFTDADSISKDRVKEVLIASENKLLSGYKDGTFKPKGELTRAEAAMLIYRASK